MTKVISTYTHKAVRRDSTMEIHETDRISGQAWQFRMSNKESSMKKQRDLCKRRKCTNMSSSLVGFLVVFPS